ncbi:MAG: IS66 family transposase, partial [Solirubrobacteraceae bacterium]
MRSSAWPLAFWPALWHFTEIPNVESTNNRAERAIRFGVLLRNRTGGTRTDHGDRYIERLLTIRSRWGPPFAGAPPHRSQRARLTHWAPPSGSGVKPRVGPWMLD